MTHSQRKGKSAELDVVRALVRSGIPARRHIRTGTKDVTDEGDIRLTTAPVTIEVKNWARGYSRGQVADLLVKLGEQRREGDLGLLVCKRAGNADPYGWDCWTDAYDAVRLLGLVHRMKSIAYPSPFEHPVGFVFGDVIRALVSGGWVTELANPFESEVS